MTAAPHLPSRIVRDLIASCHRAREDFRSAAEAVANENLKRLFDLYARQRSRFADELRSCVALEADDSLEQPDAGRLIQGNERDWLERCLESDTKSLVLYRQALDERSIPSKTHFLIASQLSLLQRVRDRMNGLLIGAPPRIEGSQLHEGD